MNIPAEREGTTRSFQFVNIFRWISSSNVDGQNGLVFTTWLLSRCSWFKQDKKRYALTISYKTYIILWYFGFSNWCLLQSWYNTERYWKRSETLNNYHHIPVCTILFHLILTGKNIEIPGIYAYKNSRLLWPLFCDRSHRAGVPNIIEK